MISIITAIYNGLPLNKLFEASLKKYTVNNYELIIIDNGSDDGSREFFQQKGYHIIVNKENYAYAVCQNQGIAVAKGEYLFFLNNDLILSPQWDARLIDIATKNNIDILSAAGIENLGTRNETKSFQRKWSFIKKPLLLLGINETSLKLMLKLMYGDWENFCNKRYSTYTTKVVEGIVGNNVMMTRKGLADAGLWDERIQAADFDLFMRVKKKSLSDPTVQTCKIALGVFIHHFVRMTSHYGGKKPPAFANADELIKLQQKWTEQELEEFHPDNSTIRKTK